MTHFIEQYGYLAVVLMVGLESLGIPLPGETTLISAALYAGMTQDLNHFRLVVVASKCLVSSPNRANAVGSAVPP